MIHPMKKSSAQTPIPSCGCNRCHCQRGLRCRCHDMNSLLALVLWDFGRMIRRQRSR